MHLITVFDMGSGEYWTPIMAHSMHSVHEFLRQTFKNNKRVMMRVDEIDDQEICDALKQGGARTLRYDRLVDGGWAWVVKCCS